MGKFSDKCKRYVGMTALAALCTFGGANKAEAKDTGNNFHLATQTSIQEIEDHNVTDSTYVHSYEASMHLFDGNKKESIMFRSCSYAHDLGDGYMFVEKSNSKIDVDRHNSNYEQYMITPDGRKLDCSFFDSNEFMLPNVTHVKRNGRMKVETHSMDEVRAHNLKMELKFKKQARENGFTEDDVAHFSKAMKTIRRSLEGGDIGRSTTDIVKSRISIKTSSMKTNNIERYKEEKGQLTANFLDFVKNQGQNL